MNLIVIVILFLTYLAFLAYLIVKLKDIFQNNKKYDKIKGWEKYRKSFWYEHIYFDRFRLSSRSYWAPIITQIPMWGIILGVFYFLSVLIQKFLLSPADSLAVFRTETFYIGFIGLMFFTIYLPFWISYNSKIPILIASTRVAFNSKTRGGEWKQLIIVLVIVTFLALPMYILSVDNYGYVTDEKLSYNPYFSFSEQEYDYDDILEVTTSFSMSDDEKDFHFSYVIVNSSGQSLDIGESGSNLILLVNDLLQDKDIVFNKGLIDRAVYEKIINTCRPETVRMINACYIIS